MIPSGLTLNLRLCTAALYTKLHFQFPSFNGMISYFLVCIVTLPKKIINLKRANPFKVAQLRLYTGDFSGGGRGGGDCLTTNRQLLDEEIISYAVSLPQFTFTFQPTWNGSEHSDLTASAGVSLRLKVAECSSS